MASGLEKLAASDKAAAEGTVKCSWDLSPKDDSRIGFLLAWSSAPLTGAYMAQLEAGTRGRNKPFPSHARKGQGRTEAAQVLASLGWLQCAFSHRVAVQPQPSAGTSSQAWQGEGDPPATLGFGSPSKQESEVFVGIHWGGGLLQRCSPYPRVPTPRQKGTPGSNSGSKRAWRNRRLVTLASPMPTPEASP